MQGAAQLQSGRALQPGRQTETNGYAVGLFVVEVDARGFIPHTVLVRQPGLKGQSKTWALKRQRSRGESLVLYMEQQNDMNQTD